VLLLYFGQINDDDDDDVSGGMTHWESRASGDAKSSAAAVEVTSYVLLATLHGLDQSQATSVLPIIRWLTTQRNARGGFSSTQVLIRDGNRTKPNRAVPQQ